jgi:hypothetical protein
VTAYGCPVGLCPNHVDDPAVPCPECVALFGGLLRPSGRPVSAAGQRDRAAAKAARAVPPVLLPIGPRPLSAADLAEEATHLVTRCGVSREDAAARLGVSLRVLTSALGSG